MATRHARITVFGGAFASLVVMSILSAALGKVILGLIPKVTISLHPILYHDTETNGHGFLGMDIMGGRITFPCVWNPNAPRSNDDARW